MSMNRAKADPKQVPRLRQERNVNLEKRAPMREYADVFGALHHFKSLEKDWLEDINSKKSDWYQVHADEVAATNLMQQHYDNIAEQARAITAEHDEMAKHERGVERRLTEQHELMKARVAAMQAGKIDTMKQLAAAKERIKETER